MEDFYQILGINSSASQDEIKARYLFLVKAYHPDRYSNPAEKQQAEDELKKINRAYEILSNEEKRRLYNFSYNSQSMQNNSKQSPQDTSETENQEQSKEHRDVSDAITKGYCQVCGTYDNIISGIYRKNIGMVFLRSYRVASGELCANCHEAVFWNVFLTNLFLGWWGIISLIINPFLIIMNIYNYIRSWKIRSLSTTTPKGRVDMKLISLLGMISIIGIYIFGGGSDSSQPKSQSYHSTPIVPTPTHEISVTSIPSNSNQTIIYSNDFSENDVDWLHSMDASGTVEISNGKLNITTGSDDCNLSKYDRTFTDGTLEVDLVGNGNLSSSSGNNIILWRLNPLGWYALLFNRDGSVNLVKLENDKFILLYTSSIEDYVISPRKNHISITFDKSKITVYIDYQFITTVFDTSFSSGSLALGLCSNDTSTASYDDLVVYSIDTSISSFFSPQSTTTIDKNSLPAVKPTTQIPTPYNMESTAFTARVLVPKPTEIPTLNNYECTHWTNVSLADVGKTMCVYGNTRNPYYDKNKDAYIWTFSADPKAFYFIKHGYHWFTKEGQCVLAEGKIQKFYDTPYIELPFAWIKYCN